MQVGEKIKAAFYVDVNSADEAGRVGTIYDAAVAEFVGDPESVDVGDYVWAVDSDDNACMALVVERKGQWLRLHMDETTWKPLSAAVERRDGDRVTLAPLSPEDALRALLRTPPHGQTQDPA